MAFWHFWRGNPYEIIKFAERKKIQLFITNEILAEILDVLNREKFSRLIEDLGLRIEELIKTILRIANLAEAKEKLEIITDDPKDNKILECTVAADADYIITGDRHLLELMEFRGIKIVKARQFLELMKF